MNVTATANSINKTSGCDGCQDAGATSTQQIVAGDGYVEFTASETTTIRGIGLGVGNTDTSMADIDFAIALWDTHLYTDETDGYCMHAVHTFGDEANSDSPIHPCLSVFSAAMAATLPHPPRANVVHETPNPGAPDDKLPF